MDHNNNNNNNNNNKPIKQEPHKPHDHSNSNSPPPKHPPPATTTAGDRMKRDEWSEGAVTTLLEAYESKWVLRNRAKLKGHDWEDVARHVSSRGNTTKSPKTQTQCKNKIESMKKRYRSESASDVVSTWPLYPRLDMLLRGSSGGGGTVRTVGGVSSPDVTVSPVPVSSNIHPMIAFDQPDVTIPVATPMPMTMMVQSVGLPVNVPVPVLTPVDQGIDSNGVDQEDKEELVVTKMPETQPSEKMEIETDCSTPALYSNETEKMQTKNNKKRVTESRKRRRRGENWDAAESIRWLAKAMMRSEQAKVETMKELEKIRADAEVKRGELDLKRTEIIAHTQLEIARLFASCLGKPIDPSLSIRRS